MLRREIVLDADGRKFALRFSCAAMALLDPEDSMSFREVGSNLTKVSFLQRAVLAALEGARRASDPAREAYTDADAQSCIDAVGQMPALKAVSEVLLAWRDPGAADKLAEGDGVPKA